MDPLTFPIHKSISQRSSYKKMAKDIIKRFSITIEYKIGNFTHQQLPHSFGIKLGTFSISPYCADSFIEKESI